MRGRPHRATDRHARGCGSASPANGLQSPHPCIRERLTGQSPSQTPTRHACQAFSPLDKRPAPPSFRPLVLSLESNSYRTRNTSPPPAIAPSSTRRCRAVAGSFSTIVPSGILRALRHPPYCLRRPARPPHPNYRLRAPLHRPPRQRARPHRHRPRQITRAERDCKNTPRLSKPRLHCEELAPSAALPAFNVA